MIKLRTFSLICVGFLLLGAAFAFAGQDEQQARAAQKLPEGHPPIERAPAGQHPANSTANPEANPTSNSSSVASAPAASQVPMLDLSPLARLVVQSNGRVKPLPTHAREALQPLFDEDLFSHQDALVIYTGLLLNPPAWLEVECFLPGPELSMELFQTPDRKMSFMDVVESQEKLDALIQSGMGMGGGQDSPRTSAQILSEQSMRLLNSAIYTFQNLAADFLFLPPLDANQETWLSLADLQRLSRADDAWAKEGSALFEKLRQVYIENKQDAFEKAVAGVVDFQRKDPSRLPSETRINIENLYYHVDVNKVGLWIFSLCSAFYLLSAFMRNHAWVKRIALLLLLAGIAWNTWIIGGRTLMGGRLPLKNLNEVYLIVLFAVPLIGLLLDRLFKNPVYSGVSAALSVVGFIGALNLDPQGYIITPLMAILDSPWREIHILTIMLSYAILLVAAGLHLGFLLVLFMQPGSRTVDNEKVRYSPLAEDLNHKAYLMVAWGFLFLTIGIATGAAWAHASWGRYWGWDPKEVWATVAWAIYGAFLHLRLFFRTRPEWLALINIVGFAAILFTYFGVTYLLSGLHAYG